MSLAHDRFPGQGFKLDFHSLHDDEFFLGTKREGSYVVVVLRARVTCVVDGSCLSIYSVAVAPVAFEMPFDRPAYFSRSGHAYFLR